MEIKSINPNSKISRIHTSSKAVLDFKNGEIIFAEIVSIDGETVTLKTKNDVLFTAQIISDLKLLPGDDLKLAVKGKKSGKFIMQALSVNADAVRFSADGLQKGGDGKQILLIANLLKKIDIQPTSGAINEIISSIEKNPGLDPKTAVFMAANGIPVTEKNVQSIKQMETKGSLIAERLVDILNQIAANEAFPEGEDAKTILKLLDPEGPYRSLDSEPLQEASQKNNIPKGVSVASNSSFYTIVPSKQAKAPRTISQPSQVKNSAEATQPPGTPAPEMFDAADGVKKTVELVFAESNGGAIQKTDRSTAAPADYAEIAGNLLNDKALRPVLEKIISIFSDISKFEDGETNIEKEDALKTEKLAELKELLKSSDIKNREVLAEKTEKIISQSKLSSDIQRFNLFHIPINTGHNRQTAELYVYKRRKNKKEKDLSQEVNILIGLDTQNLGRFEVLIKSNGRNLSVTMSRDSDMAKEIIELRAKKLKKVFAEIGFSLSDFKIERLHERTTPVNAEEILIGKSVLSSSKIDYMI